jgi:hypothetical protein
MFLGDGSQKISMGFIEPAMYIRPVYAYNPIPQVTKIYSNENFFNQETYKEYRNSKNYKENRETKRDFSGRGAIMDFRI